MQESEIFESVGGEAGIEQLVHHFYAQVPTDAILGPMYPQHELVEAEERLRDFLIYRLGGSQRYIEQRGHPRLRQRHMPFAVDRAARDQWVRLMENALALSEFPQPAAEGLREFFAEMARFLINR